MWTNVHRPVTPISNIKFRKFSTIELIWFDLISAKLRRIMVKVKWQQKVSRCERKWGRSRDQFGSLDIRWVGRAVWCWKATFPLLSGRLFGRCAVKPWYILLFHHSYSHFFPFLTPAACLMQASFKKHCRFVLYIFRKILLIFISSWQVLTHWLRSICLYFLLVFDHQLLCLVLGH